MSLNISMKIGSEHTWTSAAIKYEMNMAFERTSVLQL